MKHLRWIVPVALLALLLFLIAYRYYCGTWNPFTIPDRITVYGRRYLTSTSKPPIVLGEKEKPAYPIYSFNLLTGKRLYSTHPKGEFVPTVIYLYAGEGRYQVYSLSGGP